MAKPQDKQASTTTTTPPIKEYEQEGADIDYETFSATGCSCFRLFRLNRGRRSNGGDEDSHGLLNNQRGGDEQHKGITWLENKLKQVKEFSEVVAGPKWKNFIRRLGKCFHKNKRDRRRENQFQYSPYSYALNFDGGVDDEEEDDHGFLVNGYNSSRL